jgi:hypothetical protein
MSGEKENEYFSDGLAEEISNALARISNVPCAICPEPSLHSAVCPQTRLLAFGRAVNVTLGLPIIRTSVNHGTAFDIAGKGERRSIQRD